MTDSVTVSIGADAEGLLDALRQAQAELTALESSFAAASTRATRAGNSAAQQYAEGWLRAIKPIEGALDGMLKGVLLGTETLRQALHRMLADLALSEIEADAKRMLERLTLAAVGANPDASHAEGGPLLHGLTELGGGRLLGAAGGGGDAAALTQALTGNTTATAGNTGGLLQQIQNGLQSIAQMLGLTTTTAAQTTASGAAATATTSATAATTGGLIPALTALTAAVTANTAALAASGGAGGIAGALMVASFDVGAANISNDGLAFLHQGEMVIPAGAASVVRSGGGALPAQIAPSFPGLAPAAGAAGPGAGAGGGLTINMVTNASMLDGTGFQALYTAHARGLAQTIANYWQLNPSTRPKY